MTPLLAWKATTFCSNSWIVLTSLSPFDMPGKLKELAWSNMDRSFLLEPGTESQASIPHPERDKLSPQSCPALLGLTWIHSVECVTACYPCKFGFKILCNHGLWAHLSEPHGHFWTGNLTWWKGKKGRGGKKMCSRNIASFRCKKTNCKKCYAHAGKHTVVIMETTMKYAGYMRYTVQYNKYQPPKAFWLWRTCLVPGLRVLRQWTVIRSQQPASWRSGLATNTICS